MRRAVTAAVVGLLALVGVVALAAGIAMRTVWLPEDHVSATATVSDAGPVAVTAPGVLELHPGPVEVTARGADGSPVLLAVGRQRDVEAWVDGAGHARLTGLAAPDRLDVETVEGEPQVPDPAASDLWVQRETGTGSASLEYRPQTGRWLLLTASDGTAPAPVEVTMTWPREAATPWAVPLIVLGGLLLLAAAGVVVFLRYREVRVSAPQEETS